MKAGVDAPTDPYGILEPDQIFFQSSVPLNDPATGMNMNISILQGPCLVCLCLVFQTFMYRQLPSYRSVAIQQDFRPTYKRCAVMAQMSQAYIHHNLRQVTAVYRPEYKEYKDVIICSIKGKVSAAFPLAGGGTSANYLLHRGSQSG